MIVFFFGILGLIIGSFLNVLILRHGVRGLGGRSGCLSCGSRIHWYDNIPIVSWLLLRGRCRACGSGVSMQYPIIEFATALLFASIAGSASLYFTDFSMGSMYALSRTLCMCAAAALLIAVAAYDLRHTIIPDSWAYAFGAFALILALTRAEFSLDSVMNALIAGPLVASPLFLLWLFSRGRWMGLGDGKLSLGIGWLLGPALGFLAVMYAFVLGALVALVILLPFPLYRRALAKAGIAQRASSWSYTMKSEVPFGPFLVASCLIVWLTQLYGMPVPLALF